MSTSMLPDLGPPPESPPMRMTGMRRAALVLGGLSAVALICLAAFSLVSQLARQYETSTRTVPALGNRLTVESNGGPVHITVGASDIVRVTRHLEWSFRKPELTEVAAAGGVAVRARCRGHWNCATGYDITVPASFAVDVQGSSGALSVRGTTGAVRLRSAGGRVTATDVSGALDLHSSAGAVRGEDLRSTVVRADSSGGRVQLGFRTPPATVSAGSSAGAVAVTVPGGSGPYRVDADSSGGSTRVAVRTDPAATSRISAHSSGGEVRVSEG